MDFMCASRSGESIPIGKHSSGGDNPDVSKEAGMSCALPSSLAAFVLLSAAALATEPDLRIVSSAATLDVLLERLSPVTGGRS
jgi:hypothetical protein